MGESCIGGDSSSQRLCNKWYALVAVAIQSATTSPAVWRELLQKSFIGPLSLLKAAVDRMRPDPKQSRRAMIVIISGISSVQVLSHYAIANVIRTAWMGEAKTLAFALGEKGYSRKRRFPSAARLAPTERERDCLMYW
jgi:NAD(P)-dependent dehydrogenase (short-subunit alcohol dehydrogenase family)